MKIEVTPREENQVQIIAEVESETMLHFKQKAARKISSQAKIPGFRPGKAPYEIVRRMYGDKAIEQEAIELMLDELYPEILKEAKVEPGGSGSLEKIISNEPPKFQFLVPLMPRVELGDYRSIRQDYNAPTVTDEEVEQIVQNVRQRYSVREPAERPIQEGDSITVDLTGKFTQVAEGESADAFNQQAVDMIVGENEFEKDDWPFPNFTRELIGMSKNEEKVLIHTYGEDEENATLKGREVSITVKIVAVHTLSVPELTDEFAQSLGEGEYKSVEDLRAAIRKEMLADRTHEYDDDYFTRVIDQIAAISTISYPPQVLDHEVEHILENLEQSLSERKMDLPTYLKAINTDREAFIESEAKPAARRRLSRSLIMDEIARAEKININMSELEQSVTGTMQALQASPNGVKLPRGASMQDFTQNIAMETASRMLSRDTLLRLKLIATGQADKIEEQTVQVEPEPAAESTPVESPAADPVVPPTE